MNDPLLDSVTAIFKGLSDKKFDGPIQIFPIKNRDGENAMLLIRAKSSSDRGVMIDALIASGFSSPNDWSLKEINQNIPWESYPDLAVFLGSFHVVQTRKDGDEEVPESEGEKFVFAY